MKAVVQRAVGVSPSAALEVELIGFARACLARYNCPKSIDFVDELPRLPTGKLHKGALKARYWEQAGRVNRL